MFADGSLGMRRIWWLQQCSHLMVPLCIVVCPVGARLTAVSGAVLYPVALLLTFLPISGSFFFCWHAHRCWCAPPPPPASPRKNRMEGPRRAVGQSDGDDVYYHYRISFTALHCLRGPWGIPMDLCIEPDIRHPSSRIDHVGLT